MVEGGNDVNPKHPARQELHSINYGQTVEVAFNPILPSVHNVASLILYVVFHQSLSSLTTATTFQAFSPCGGILGTARWAHTSVFRRSDRTTVAAVCVSTSRVAGLLGLT